ncbi:O-acyltransferase like protein-like isoform 2-T2 [Cochliomyia hominivorax]
MNFFPILNILKIMLVFTTFCQGHNNVSGSNKTPALYNFDNYQQCMNHYESTQSFPAKYSMVFVEIQPNKDSPIWQEMHKMNESKFKYRHDIIFRGVCLERCKHFLNNYSNKNITHDGFLVNDKTKQFQTIFSTSLDRVLRYEYHKNIHECINEEYMEIYNLSTKTSVIYGLDPQKPMEKVNRYFTAFSLYRNYKKLILPNKGDIGNDLAFLDGFRVISCLLILCEHVFITQFIHLENSEYIEYLYNQLWFRLTLPGLIWLEFFFILSGLLLFVKFERGQYIETTSSFKDCVSVFVRLMISRYLRYLPSLVFIIMFTANIKYYDKGPFTRFLLESNCVPCREHWWYNILTITNYKMKSVCLPQTWYIAAEFHLYVFFLLILIVMAKYPNTKTLMLSGVAILAAAINFGVNYGLKLEPIMLMIPEAFRYSYFQHIETPKHLYFSSYTNINSFLLGILCGLIYMRYLRKNPENKQKLGKILKYTPYLGWPCMIAILYLGTTIMEQTETTIWSAAYGLLHRHVGLAIVSIIVILRGFCFGGGIFKMLPFRFLSRISYQFYLWQLISLYFVFAVFIEKPLNVNLYVLILIGIFVNVSSNVIAFVMTLFIEYPFAEIIATLDIEKNLRPAKSESREVNVSNTT